jgi:L-lactate dehydrogenase complex protein LldG
VSADARSAIFARLRQQLAGRAPAAARRQAVAARLARPAPTLIPARADLDLAGRIALFTAQAEAVQASVQRVPDAAALPAAIAAYLRARNLPLRLVAAEDPLLAAADWAGSLIELRHGAPVESDAVGVTVAAAGIAETGTLLLLSAPARPTLLAFLPETAIVVLPSTRVLRAYEDALAELRAAGRPLPRSMSFVTGPSRSGDIEQTLQLGAHGPRQLLILLVDQPGAGAAAA